MGMLKVIRGIDTQAIVILGTRFWSGSGGQYGPADAAANPVDSKYNPVMYTKHFYAASHHDQDELAGLTTSPFLQQNGAFARLLELAIWIMALPRSGWMFLAATILLVSPSAGQIGVTMTRAENLV